MAEAQAIRAVFGGHPVRVGSTKGATGHMMGAGGITEIIACVQSVRTGLLPPTLGLTTPGPECRLTLVGSTAERSDVLRSGSGGRFHLHSPCSPPPGELP